MSFSQHTHTGHYPGSAPVPGMFKEAVGVFSRPEDLQEAIRTLEGSAFPRQDISVMGQRDDLGKIFHDHPPETTMEAMDDPSVPRDAPARPEEQTIGASALIGGAAYVGAMAMALSAGAVAMPAIVGAAVIGAAGGGTIGAILTKLLGDRYHRAIEEQVARGGLLLWVRTPDEHKEMLAKVILRQHHAQHVHIQEMI